jgi:eukaryotic-like serine/threonine-protein kinase
MPVTPRDTEQTLVGTAWLPGYELLGLVGVGGHGQVFKARQLALDRVVAVKLVNLDSAVRTQLAIRFEREAVALGRFHHPNIVPVFDYGRHNDHLFMAMELLDGEDLGNRVRRNGPIDERTAWQIGRQAAAGLAHAHGHGVIHRDVKPANLFLVPAPTGLGLPDGVPMVKLLDFGLARAHGEVGSPDDPHTDLGVIVGTPAYMAPEQHNGGELDHRADIYALGATVYHALSGRMPFPGQSVWEVMANKLEQKLPPLGDLSPQSAELIGNMMDPDPERRIRSYDELIARIDRLLRSSPDRMRARRFAAYWPHAVIAAGVTAAVAISLTNYRGPHVDAREGPPAEFVPTGRMELLFDGSLGHWTPLGGEWAVARDEEKGKVIEGIGTIRRPLPAAESFRVVIGLDVHDATAVEVQFAFPADQTARRFALRICPDSGAVLGTRNGERGSFASAGAPVPFPRAGKMKSPRPYREVRIERVGRSWSAWFNGEPAGRLDDDGVDELSEIRLWVQGGEARIDSAALER